MIDTVYNMYMYVPVPVLVILTSTASQNNMKNIVEVLGFITIFPVFLLIFQIIKLKKNEQIL